MASSVNVGVLGGTRFIGFHLVEALLAQGAKVSVFHRGRTREPRPFSGPVARFLGDRDRPDDLGLFFQQRYDAVIDLSGFSLNHVSPIFSRWRDKIGHYLFCSSSSVYRTPLPLLFDESSPRSMEGGTYGGDKALAEDALLEQWGKHGWPVTILRPQGVFGAIEAPAALYVMRRIAAGEPVLIRPGTAGRKINPIFVGDLADCFIKAIGRPQAFGRAFNAAGASACAPKDFGVLIERIVGQGRFESIDLDDRISPLVPDLGLPWLGHDLAASTTKLREALDVALTPLEEALRRTWDWARSLPGELDFRPQRWEREARTAHIPSMGTRFAWRAYDVLRRQPAVSGAVKALKLIHSDL